MSLCKIWLFIYFFLYSLIVTALAVVMVAATDTQVICPVFVLFHCVCVFLFVFSFFFFLQFDQIGYKWMMIHCTFSGEENIPFDTEVVKFILRFVYCSHTISRINSCKYSLIGKDHLGDGSLEKYCCLRLTFQKPVCKEAIFRVTC